LPLPLHTTNFVFSGLVKAHVLVYGQSVLYTWDDPTVEQKLVCSVVEHESTETEIKLNAVSKPSVCSRYVQRWISVTIYVGPLKTFLTKNVNRNNNIKKEPVA